jgi:hypothetical protein
LLGAPQVGLMLKGLHRDAEKPGLIINGPLCPVKMGTDADVYIP